MTYYDYLKRYIAHKLVKKYSLPDLSTGKTLRRNGQWMQSFSSSVYGIRTRMEHQGFDGAVAEAEVRVLNVKNGVGPIDYDL
jgi:hypothetical protein